MKANTLLNRYLVRELIPPFLINMVFFSFIFLMRQILDITDLIVNYRVSPLTFLLMLAFSMPYFLVYIIPMSVMMSVLLTFIRMSSDNEITALKAGGVSLYQLLFPVLVFAALCTLLTAAMTFYGMPWGAASYRQLALSVAQDNLSVGLEEQQFNDSFEGVTFYVNQIRPKKGELLDVFIQDQREAGVSSTVVAPQGRLFAGASDYSFTLRLYSGIINQVNLDDRSAHTIRFDTYDLHLSLKKAVSDIREKEKDEKEMTFSELKEALGKADPGSPRYYELLLELHEKFSIPFASLALAVLALPLGIRSFSSRKSAGLGIGLLAFLIYYLLLSTGLIFGETGLLPPAVGMWAPNLIMGGAGIYLLVKAANDRPVLFFRLLREGFSRLLARGRGKGAS
jgi:lipopolysaccharide export system permease protein